MRCSESSETIRQASTQVVEDIVRAAWRHAEVDRNDQPLGNLQTEYGSFQE